MELRPGRRPGLSGSIKYRGVCGPSGRRPGYTRPGRRKPAKRRGILWSRWLLAPRWGAKTARTLLLRQPRRRRPKGPPGRALLGLRQALPAERRGCRRNSVRRGRPFRPAADFLIYKQFYKHLI